MNTVKTASEQFSHRAWAFDEKRLGLHLNQNPINHFLTKIPAWVAQAVFISVDIELFQKVKQW